MPSDRGATMRIRFRYTIAVSNTLNTFEPTRIIISIFAVTRIRSIIRKKRRIENYRIDKTLSGRSKGTQTGNEPSSKLFSSNNGLKKKKKGISSPKGRIYSQLFERRYVSPGSLLNVLISGRHTLKLSIKLRKHLLIKEKMIIIIIIIKKFK